jgi:hypothetical protein
MEITILGSQMAFIYTDDLVDLLDEGVATIKRVSHVEPSPIPGGGIGWTADMSPVDGKVLGPFVTRQEALDTEVAWLKRERGL